MEENGVDLASLRIAVSAGETLPAPVCERWMTKTGKPILDGIGATEMLHIFISNRVDDLRPGSTGLPLTGYQARIVNEDMNELPHGTVGRLAVKGPVGCRYLADPERQAAYVRDGWNLTGDSFIRDADGHLNFAARSDDMIISAGYNIAGPEVETALLTHPYVAECAVVGAPDPGRGMIVEAHIVLAAGVDPSPETVKILQDHVKATIAPYKYPRSVKFVAALPKTATGKLQRFALKNPS
jgi:2-aminobenzoate-CoA ligase